MRFPPLSHADREALDRAARILALARDAALEEKKRLEAAADPAGASRAFIDSIQYGYGIEGCLRRIQRSEP